jgi:hypothetical protein
MRPTVPRVAVRRGLAILLLTGCGFGDVDAQLVNGFDLAGAAVPADTILIGTVRDGIKALDAPGFVSVVEADDLPVGTRVLGLVHGGVAKAYPLDMLVYHEIVNDQIGGGASDTEDAPLPVAVTYCPLCASGVAFVAEHEGQPLVETTWADWKQHHPDTLVLSRDTGFGFRYSEPLYPGYDESPQVWYPVEHEDDSIPAKDLVLGVVLDGRAKAWPIPELQREAERLEVDSLVLEQSLGERTLSIHYDARSRSATARNAAGDVLPAVVSYWFAWHTFHPRGEVYRSDPDPPDGDL